MAVDSGISIPELPRKVEKIKPAPAAFSLRTTIPSLPCRGRLDGVQHREILRRGEANHHREAARINFNSEPGRSSTRPADDGVV